MYAYYEGGGETYHISEVIQKNILIVKRYETKDNNQLTNALILNRNNNFRVQTNIVYQLTSMVEMMSFLDKVTNFKLYYSTEEF